MDGSDPVLEPVSTTRGTWSVVFAVASPIVGLVVALAGLFIATRQGTLSDPRFATALAVSNLVAIVVLAATATVAVILGITSIVQAWPEKRRPRRSKAIARGWIGIGLTALLVSLYATYYLWLQFD